MSPGHENRSPSGKGGMVPNRPICQIRYPGAPFLFRFLQAELHSGRQYQLSSVHNDVFQLRKGQDTAADVKIGPCAQIQADLSIADRESPAADLDAGVVQTAQAVNTQPVLVHKVIIDIAIEFEPIDLDPALI